MIYLKKAYLIPFTLWCGLVFGTVTAVLFIILLLLLNFGGQKAYRWAHEIPTYCGKIIAKLWFVKVHISYQSTLDTQKQYIFVGNHRSMLDAIISAGFIPNLKKFIGKAEILKWPFVGYLLKKLYIPVQRDQKDSRKWSMVQLLEKMKEGMSIVIFSEGTCNATENVLLTFKEGAYRASAATQIPILPFVIIGADRLWHRSVWLIKPGSVSLHFLDPVAPPISEDIDEITKQRDLVFEKIHDYYIQNN